MSEQQTKCDGCGGPTQQLADRSVCLFCELGEVPVNYKRERKRKSGEPTPPATPRYTHSLERTSPKGSPLRGGTDT